MKATAEYATANIAVWWDMKDCPIPEGYEAGRVRSSLEAAFKEQGYSGPVSITAYGNQTQTPAHILKGLLSTGVSVAHTRSESTCHLMYEDLVEWRGRNPPPATVMIISDQVGDKFTWDLVRPSIEEAVKELGYSGPVSITAYGDHKHTPLQALSSSGVDIAHTVCG
ncbi:hypothetical protein Bca52824_015111 [Brassica carinata]|uniref:NYN domain-containing protein n=1 Tax=Brassica carinata TaxID=52824 RepID=A0A8X7W4C4_BRACI|nr:hypothetical protein Bca52824_015111 [Brassica carinata]